MCNISQVRIIGTVQCNGTSLSGTTAEAMGLLSYLRAFMSFGVKMSLVTAGRGSSENVARCRSCKDGNVVGDTVIQYAASGLNSKDGGARQCHGE